MPKQSPVPNELTKPFWDACNEGRLIMQACKTCDLMHYPPKQVCNKCGSGDNMEWRETSGRGSINGYAVMYDSRIRLLQENQPFNIAVVSLEDDPGILMYSHLPGVPVDEVPVGAKVKVTFEATPTGQKVYEWVLAD